MKKTLMVQTLTQRWPQLSAQQQTYVIQMYAHYRNEFARMKREVANPESEAVSTHDVIDREIASCAVEDAQNHARVQCQEGCAHCCKMNVTVTMPEAILLLIIAEEIGRPIDWARVKRQASHADARWHDQPVADRACIFLDADNRCSVYEYRPLACRRHFVVSDPDLCDISKHGFIKVQWWAPVLVDVLESVALAVNEHGSMPVMLQRAKKQRPALKNGDKDWTTKCMNCGELPTLHPTELCGPCCTGEADTKDGNW